MLIAVVLEYSQVVNEASAHENIQPQVLGGTAWARHWYCGEQAPLSERLTHPRCSGFCRIRHFLGKKHLEIPQGCPNSLVGWVVQSCSSWVDCWRHWGYQQRHLVQAHQACSGVLLLCCLGGFGTVRRERGKGDNSALFVFGEERRWRRLTHNPQSGKWPLLAVEQIQASLLHDCG